MKLPRLIALSPGDLTPDDVPLFLERVEAALDGGLPGLLFRESRLEDGAWLVAFEAVRERAARDVVWLGAHDRVHLGVIGGADAVHLGFRSLAPAPVRELVEEGIAIGLSTHAGDDVATWRDADYLFHGPVHATPSKKGWQEPIGFDGLARAVRATALPILALGGLRPGDVPAALAAGAHGIAALSGILGAEDPAAAARRYRAGLGDAPETMP